MDIKKTNEKEIKQKTERCDDYLGTRVIIYRPFSKSYIVFICGFRDCSTKNTANTAIKRKAKKEK